MSKYDSTFWRDFLVHNTLSLEKLENVKSTCDIMIRDYIKLERSNNFSYRIILPWETTQKHKTLVENN